MGCVSRGATSDSLLLGPENKAPAHTSPDRSSEPQFFAIFKSSTEGRPRVLMSLRRSQVELVPAVETVPQCPPRVSQGSGTALWSWRG